MSDKTVLSQRLLKEKVAACKLLRPVRARIAMMVFSENIQENLPKDSWAGVFKYMVFFAFQLNFSLEMVVAVCRGSSQLSGLEVDDIENLAKEIASGKFVANDIDRIFSNHYKTEEPLFPETRKEFWSGDVVMVADLSTGLITNLKPIKPKNDGLEAFQVGM